MACTERHGHAALAAAGVEHASRPHAVDLALELLEFGIARAALDQLLRLAPDEHADPLLEELEPHAPAQPAVLLLLRGHVPVARIQMREPRADTRGQLGVARIGMLRPRPPRRS